MAWDYRQWSDYCMTSVSLVFCIADDSLVKREEKGAYSFHGVP